MTVQATRKRRILPLLAGGLPSQRASAVYLFEKRKDTDWVTRQKEAFVSTVKTEMWSYQSGLNARDVVGYDVEAIDGGIGKIDDATYDAGSSYVVVDTGPWIFGKKVMLPAGVIDRIDPNDEKVFVNRTKDEIKDAPEFDENRYRDDQYRDDLGSYYGPGGTGYRDSRNW